MKYSADDDTYIDYYIEKRRKEYASAWEAYLTEDDDDIYQQRDDLNRILEQNFIF